MSNNESLIDGSALPKDERKKLIEVNKSILMIFVAQMSEHVRKMLVDNEKDLNQLSQKFRDSVLEQTGVGLKLSEGAEQSLKLLEGTNELDFAKKERQNIDVEWLMGLLLLIIGRKDLVDLRSPDATWDRSRDFLVSEIMKDNKGLCKTIT